MAAVGVQTRSCLQRYLRDYVDDSCSKNLRKAYTYQNPVCYMCCGFYGPSFEQPLCATCHAFLYPADINLQERALLYEEKSDSEDSGTEEPSDFYEMVRHPEDRPARVVVWSVKCDKLAECICALSCPRNKESLPEGLAENLPLEVLRVLFSYLDDLSLWTCGQVCKRWRQVLDRMTSESLWQRFVNRRWPLLRPHFTVTTWRLLYACLVDSSNCIRCLHQMLSGNCVASEDSSWRMHRLEQELKSLNTDPPEGIEAIPLDGNFSHWQARIMGPEDSPYEGGCFLLYLQIPNSYPMRPPIVRFLTKIFHPNISRHGDIGLDSINHNWTLALTIAKVLISIQSLLTDPYCHVCMEPDVGKLYSEDRSSFDCTARLWTHLYAMNHRPPVSSQPDVVWHTLESG